MRVVDQDMNDVPVGEVGEIVIRGHNVMKCYHRNQTATQEVFRNGWFRSGDLGNRDADGYYYIVGRHQVAQDAHEVMHRDLVVGPMELGSQGEMVGILDVSERVFDVGLSMKGLDDVGVV